MLSKLARSAKYATTHNSPDALQTAVRELCTAVLLKDGITYKPPAPASPALQRVRKASAEFLKLAEQMRAVAKELGAPFDAVVIRLNPSAPTALDRTTPRTAWIGFSDGGADGRKKKRKSVARVARIRAIDMLGFERDDGSEVDAVKLTDECVAAISLLAAQRGHFGAFLAKTGGECSAADVLESERYSAENERGSRRKGPRGRPRKSATKK